jgi:hypothetical protein
MGMPGSLDLREGSRRWATLELQSLTGRGRLNPRLQLVFAARPAEYSRVNLRDITLRLEHQQELVGEGRVVGVEIQYASSQVVFDVVTSPRLLRWITDHLAPTSTYVQLDATLFGLASFWIDPGTPPGHLRQWMVDDPEPGVWKEFVATASNTAILQVARADWYSQVLATTRDEQYRYLEVALPRGDKVLGQEWANAMSHLDNAERAYSSGDDTAVFSHLRGLLDALPGAKQAILDDIKDETKRTNLNELLKRAGDFLHSGRHVTQAGEAAGTFPVDHLDAAFALDLMRVFASHLSLMLSSERQRP